MKKNKTRYRLGALFVTALLFTTACTSTPSTQEEPPTNITTNPQSEQKEAMKEKSRMEIIHETLEKFNSLKIGQPKEEVASILGDNYVETRGILENEPLWRYDLGAIEGYSFDVNAGQGEVDVQGLVNHDLDIIVFVTWDENEKVSMISAIYQKDDQKMYEYVIASDGRRGEYNADF